jgi:hypothetical protein
MTDDFDIIETGRGLTEEERERSPLAMARRIMDDLDYKGFRRGGPYRDVDRERAYQAAGRWNTALIAAAIEALQSLEPA